VSSLVKVKKVKSGIAVHGTPSHSYGVSLAIWDHTVLPATCVGWKVTLCDPIRQVTPRSSEMTCHEELRHLTLTCSSDYYGHLLCLQVDVQSDLLCSGAEHRSIAR